MLNKRRFIPIMFLALFALSACNKGALKQVPEKEITIQTYEDKRGRVNLMGEMNKAALQQAPYSSWFQSRYDKYMPNEAVIAELKKPIQNYEIEAYFGTWCGDSKRDVPRFYKILDAAGYNLNRLTIVAVGNEGALYKKSPDGETEGKDITNVPTFIFYDKDGNEVNRIVEDHVGASLEEDILKVVTNQGYKHKYADF